MFTVTIGAASKVIVRIIANRCVYTAFLRHLRHASLNRSVVGRAGAVYDVYVMMIIA